MTPSELSALIEEAETALASGDFATAMDACDRALDGHEGDTTPVAIADALLRCGINLGATLARQGRMSDGVQVFEDVLFTLGERPEPELQMGLALAGLNRARAIGASVSDLEGEKAALEAAERHEKNPDPALRAITVKAMNLAAGFAGRQGAMQRADTYHKAVLALSGEAELPGAEAAQAAAHCQALYQLDPAADPKGMRDAVEAFLARYEGSTHPDIQRNMAEAGLLLCQALEGQGDLDGAMTGYRRAIADASAAADRHDMTSLLAHAELNLGRILGRQGKSADALQAFDSIVERFKGSPDMAIRQNVVDALYLSACLHAKDGDADRAAALLHAVSEQAGGIEPAMIADDPHFAAIRDTDAFRALLEDLSKAELEQGGR